jgi:hypothetical protein
VKSTEFLSSSIMDSHYESIWELMHAAPTLYENYENVQEFSNLMSRLPVANNITAGNEYSILSILAMPPGSLLSIKRVEALCLLTQIANGKYEFNIGGTIKQFPEGDAEIGDSFKTTLLFLSVNDMQHARTMMHSSLAQWRIKDNLL